ncbi:MAG: altronate dehydratase family protein [Pseudomonadota bacterium]
MAADSVTSPNTAPSNALLRVHPEDDVAVALAPIPGGAELDIGDMRLRAAADIPRGHKIALRAIPAGAPVRKYGFPIGRASADIAAGEHVHSHNLATALSGVEDYAYAPAPIAPAAAPKATFRGYLRASGRVGTRNEIWILTTVGCVTRTAQRLAAKANAQFAGRVDGVYAFTHPHGCSQLGDDLGRTRKVLAGLAGHPNAGGVLLVGLGCESNQLNKLIAEIPDLDRSRMRAFAAQTADDEMETGMAAIEDLVAIAEKDQREERRLSDLVIGLKCGGSDGFSGLTANPLVGAVADRVSAAGGTPILTEIPEVFGAERLLMARAKDSHVFDETVAVVNDFKRYFIDHGQPVYENPSPGNKDGGITTLEEKSLGAVQKGGHAALADVLRYGEQAHEPGLALLEAPGNDAVSSTALCAAGATVILFTTGRGTPLGFPAPTLKIATNSALAQKKPHWIDYDAGAMVEGKSFDQAADELFQLVLDTASGAPARNEQNDEREIAIWKNGVTM